jgi:hypothetical protein
MKLNYLIFASLFFFLFQSCDNIGNDKNEETLIAKGDSLLKEVMAIHDEVMPKTLVLENLKKKISKRLANPNLDSLSKEDYMQTIQSLDSAIEGMREWMYGFERPSDSLEAEKIIDYYTLEVNKMTKVRKQTFAVLPKAEALLNSSDSL